MDSLDDPQLWDNAERIVSFQPDHSGQYVVRFTADDNSHWTEPVLGWAVIAQEVNVTEPWDLGVVTAVEPVVLDDGTPATMSAYLQARTGITTWKVVSAAS